MRFNDIFSSGMVFAKGQPIRVYGFGTGTAQITFSDMKQEVTAENGEWFVEFPAMEYGGPYELTLTSADEQIALNDIYVGEVYFFAGQSNMQFKIKEGEDDPAFCETNELLRLFSTRRIAGKDFYTPEDGWVKAEKEMAPEWSALAHYAGIQLVKSKKVAIGIIVGYQGASVIESWVPKDILEQNGIVIDEKDKRPMHHSGPYSVWNHNGQLYEHMISQVAPFSLSGVVWYQGEGDTSVAESKVYGQELAILIDTWRKDFRNENLPFVIVQIADYDGAASPEGWRGVQQAQYDIQFSVPNVTSVISADVSQSNIVHPPQKYALSQRVSQAILSLKK